METSNLSPLARAARSPGIQPRDTGGALFSNCVSEMKRAFSDEGFPGDVTMGLSGLIWGTPVAGWFNDDYLKEKPSRTMEKSLNMDDLGVAPF